jgi:ADP-ribose pyrophosphatase YjhB (NUDIX family)
LRRELREEIGLTVLSAKVIDLFDRPQRGALAVLFQTVLRKGRLKLRDSEIRDAAFLNRLPAKATPSVRYFWARHFTRKARKTTGLEL